MSDQKNWDAALIKTWRMAGTIGDAFNLFHTLTGAAVKACEPPLKRIPPDYLHPKSGTRTFVATYLGKISARLWEQAPEKDIHLLLKLETSSYDCERIVQHDPEMSRVRRNIKANHDTASLARQQYRRRNDATNWNVTKGPTVTKRRR